MSKDGYCSAWGKDPENCYLIKKAGKRFEVLNAKKAIIGHWSK